jgi:hypothetical protein
MQTEEITIRVDPEAARAFRAASEQERQKLDLLLSLRLHEALHPSDSLQEARDQTDRGFRDRSRVLPPRLVGTG